MDVAKSFGHVFVVSFLGGLASLAFGAWFSVTLVAVYVKYQPNGNGSNSSCQSGSTGTCSSAKVIGLIVFITFAGYWYVQSGPSASPSLMDSAYHLHLWEHSMTFMP